MNMQEQEKKCWNSKYSRIKLSVYDTNNKLNVFFSFVITSYSIHYTKLYEMVAWSPLRSSRMNEKSYNFV